MVYFPTFTFNLCQIGPISAEEVGLFQRGTFVLCRVGLWNVPWRKENAIEFELFPIGSMGLVYLPTWMVDFMVNVGKYTIHGSSGLEGCWLNV